MKLKMIAATLLAALSTASFAADQTLTFVGNSASFGSTAPLLAGGNDVLTFTGLAAGTYEIVLTMSSQYINWTTDASTFNDTAFSIATFSPAPTRISFGYLESTEVSPFTLTLVGAGTDASRALYSGELTVTAVPEPETYALMLAGLAAVGFVARRRRPA